jgi:murein DD-endopeptidase MepM/ murein hydrolase activator NlpD
MRRTRTLFVVPFLAMLGAACGQIGGVHGTPAAAGATGSGPNTSMTGYPGPGALGGVDPHMKSFGGNSAKGSGTILTRRIGNKLITKRRVGNKIITTIKTTTVPPVLHSTVLNIKGPLYVCPVQGQFSVGDDFGAPRYTGGYHPHAGNDIFASTGTPIVAPFDGVASEDPNGLGGNAVKVFGRDGYVYNAHLSAYGRMGAVHAGDVIGYVGQSGDARTTPPHDHFEWHPYAGPTIPWVSTYGYRTIDSGTTLAVDPYPYLYEACHGGLPV